MNATTLAPARKAKSKTTRSAVEQAPSPIANEKYRRNPQEAAASKTACFELAQLLHAASMTDEAQEDNGNASRLLRLASATAERTALLEWSEFNPENDIYDVAALISAAFRTPGDVAGPERTALVSQAWNLLVQLTESKDRAEIDDALYSKQPAANISHWLNAKQFSLVLETVASKARTAQQMLMLLQSNDLGEQYAQDLCVDATVDILTMIGAMADHASGGGVIGDANHWFYGPNFDTTGKAVEA